MHHHTPFSVVLGMELRLPVWRASVLPIEPQLNPQVTSVCAYRREPGMVDVRQSEDSFWNLVFSFHYVGPEGQVWAVRLACPQIILNIITFFKNKKLQPS